MVNSMVILTGGKTGGHITPLIALARHLDDCLYVGEKGGLEEKLCKENNIKFYGIYVKNNLFSMISNSHKIKMANIKYIISTGGYVSVPMILYGIRNNIPIFMIEGNIVLGRTVRLFKPFTKKIFLSYPCIKESKKFVVSGMPLLEKSNVVLDFDFDILIVGSSLGSKPLCDLVFSLNERYKILLIAGRYYKDYENIKNVKVYEYHSNLVGLMRKSKLVISRAGAMSSYEIFSIGKPCVIIPSITVSHNHQVINAKYFSEEGACVFLDEGEASNEILNVVTNLLNSDNKISDMLYNQRRITNKKSIDIIIKEIKNELS